VANNNNNDNDDDNNNNNNNNNNTMDHTKILFHILESRHIPDILLKAIVDVFTQNKIMIKFYNKI
jgi:hypothetical protein